MTKSTIKWGILGPGKIAHEFVSDFQYVKNSEVVSVASRSLDRATAFAKKFNIKKSYGSYEELYEDPEVEVIYIATPHNFHFEQSLAAMEAGKAVLCEKPIVTRLQDLDILIRKAKEKDVYLMEGMWMYFLPAIKKAQHWLRQGKVGNIKCIKSDFGFPVAFDPNGRMYNPDLAGGTLLDMGIYPVAMANLWLGDSPSELKVAARMAKTGVDADVVATLAYADATAILHSSFECRLSNLTHIIGEEGTIVIPDFWGAKKAQLFKDGALIDKFEDTDGGRGFRYEIQAVTNDLLSGRKESSVLSHKVSGSLQKIMTDIIELFP